MSLSLRTTFALISALVICLLTLVLSTVIGKKTTHQVEETIGTSLSQVAYQMADKLDHFMWSRAGEIEVLSELLSSRENAGDAKELRNLLERLKKSFPSYTWVAFIDPEGKVTASTDGILTGTNIASRPVFTEGRKGRFIGDVHEAVLLAKLLPNPSGEPLQFVDISTPVYNKQGQLTGVLAAHLSWEWSREVEAALLQPLKEKMNQLEVLIVSKKENTVLLGPKESLFRPLETQSLRRAQAGSNGWLTETYPNGQTYLSGYAYGDGYLDYPGLGWSVLVREPADVAFSSVRELKTYITAAGIILSIVFAVLAAFLAGWVVRPLQRITRSADLLRKGEPAVFPAFTFIREIRILSDSLRNLVDNLTKTEHALDHMSDLALHDKLTGLPNRIALDAYLEQAMSQAKENGTTLTFLYLDLDGFKKVNDSLGHLFGDKLLQQTALRLTQGLSPDSILSRVGGDEFVIVLPTGASAPDPAAIRLAGSILEKMNEPFLVDDQALRIGCSIGASVWPLHHEDPIETMRLADQALYMSKRSGKNRVTFSPDSRENM
ncbi:sensor domain-containing diguanylate cyclase [Paenibacillus sp. UNC499MF]|uniref:sensor domain-containing diguanylate cyclase n=1 Tax=Paenibacillus sp. UNC499MF TaxID=1502751 RepID=UPI00089FA80B|nr:sensor domain-containing diguanylate cyclase [Paenibacillus sp. UNC499MF]SEF66644.1 diguanylate cyclase (GGDEF) domain-containing protein [Paenibacillus sp. UNC499MF]